MHTDHKMYPKQMLAFVTIYQNYHVALYYNFLSPELR